MYNETSLIRTPIVSEVSSFQRLQEWYLGWEKVSYLERCPQFRSVLIERGSTLHVCIYTHYVLTMYILVLTAHTQSLVSPSKRPPNHFFSR